jgi:hypothetical protein
MFSKYNTKKNSASTSDNYTVNTEKPNPVPKLDILGKNTLEENRKMTSLKEAVAGGSKTGNLSKQKENKSEFPSLGSDKCGICNKKVAGKDKALQCEICFVWYHCGCEGIDDQTYNLLSNDGNKDNPLLHYFCSKQCNKPASKFLRGLIELETEMQKLSTKVSEVDSKVMQVGSKVEEIAGGKFTPDMIETVREISQGQVSVPAGQAPAEVATMIEEKTKDQLAEMEDRVRRKTNILIFGIKENKEKAAEERKKKDEEKVNQLLSLIKVTESPVDMRRLGSFAKEGDKIRPLRLTFNSEATRNGAIAAFHKARKAAGNGSTENKDFDLAQVSVRKDLTPKERAEEAVLYQELKQKRQEAQESGDTYAHWIRRKGKIENVGRYPKGGAGNDG